MGSQVYASALIRISFSEIQHRGAAYTRVGHLGTGIARGNAKLDNAHYFTKKPQIVVI